MTCSFGRQFQHDQMHASEKTTE